MLHPVISSVRCAGALVWAASGRVDGLSVVSGVAGFVPLTDSRLQVENLAEVYITDCALYRLGSGMLASPRRQRLGAQGWVVYTDWHAAAAVHVVFPTVSPVPKRSGMRAEQQA